MQFFWMKVSSKIDFGFSSFSGTIGSDSLSLFEDDLACAENQFKCLHLNLNQILTMHDWNRHPRKCIPQSFR